MKIKIKFRHFCGTIQSSIIGLITVTVLSIAITALLLTCKYLSNNNAVVSFLVGIIASIISSVIYGISVKYLRSLSAYEWILDQTEILVTWLTEDRNSVIHDDSQRLQLWSDIVAIRDRSRELTSTNEFDKLNIVFSEIVKAAYAKQADTLSNAVNYLISEKNNITKK